MELLTKPSLADLAAADRLVLAPAAAAPLRRAVTLLARGGFVRVTTGSSVRELLVDQFHIAPGYLEKEIKIVFLDASPVDDLDGAVLRDGATLALSGAMPGLVGAAMRRDGLSWMRAGITHHETRADRPVGPGVIFVKLFNRVMEDLGESFLRRGVTVAAPDAAAFFERLAPDESFWRECAVEVDGAGATPRTLAQWLAGRAWVSILLTAPDSRRQAWS